MRLRFGVVVLAAAVAAALPLHALSDNLGDAIMAAKGFDFAGPNQPPDLIDDNGTPTIGDGASAAAAAAWPTARASR